MFVTSDKRLQGHVDASIARWRSPWPVSIGLCPLFALVLATAVIRPAAAQQFPQFPQFPRYAWEQNLRLTSSDRSVVPGVVLHGGLVISTWGPQVASAPTLAVFDMASGECLWKLSDADAAWTISLIDSQVFVSRRNAAGVAWEHVWLDVKTGQEVRRLDLAVEENESPMYPLETVGVTRGRDIYDLATARLRGSLPVEIEQMFTIESQDSLLASVAPFGSTELTLISLIDFREIGRVDTQTLNLPDIGARSRWHPAAFNDAGVVILQHWSGFGPNERRMLAAIDIIRGELLWVEHVPSRAPVIFVDDLDHPDDEAQALTATRRALLFEWTTGRRRISEAADTWQDVANWSLTQPGHLLDERTIGDLRVVRLRDGSVERLLGLNASGQAIWHRESVPVTPGLGGFALTRFQLSEDGRFGVEVAAHTLWILDLETGMVRHEIKPESMGLSLGSRLETASRPNAAGEPEAADANSGAWTELSTNTVIALATTGLLLFYLMFRQLASSRSARPLDSHGSA